MNPFGNPQKLLKQLQSAQERIQREIAEMSLEASAGGGMVKVVMTGDMQVRSVEIDPAAVDPEDVDLLSDMVAAAVNEAVRAAQELGAQKMAAVTGGMNIPGLM